MSTQMVEIFLVTTSISQNYSVCKTNLEIRILPSHYTKIKNYQYTHDQIMRSIILITNNYTS